LCSVGVGLLEQSLSTLSIPGVNGYINTPIGNTSYGIFAIDLTSLTLESYYVTVNDGQGLTLNIDNLGLSVSLDWFYEEESWPNFRDHGTATVSASQSTATMVFSIVNNNNVPNVMVLSNVVTLENLQIQVQGGAGWFYQIFIDLLLPEITQILEVTLAAEISQNTDSSLNQALSTFPLEIPVCCPNSSLVEIDYSLLGEPTFAGNYMTINDVGELYMINDPSECGSPYCFNQTIPDTLYNDFEAQIIISDFTAQSASYSFFGIGILNGVIEASDVPADSPIQLNTSSFKIFLEQLYDAFPNAAMQVIVSPSEPPMAIFSSEGMLVTSGFFIQVQAMDQSTGNFTDAFVLAGNGTGKVDLTIVNQLLIGNMTVTWTQFTLYDSVIGTFNPIVIDDLTDLLIEKAVIPAINSALKVGFPLPSVQGLTLINPELTFGPHYLCIGSNITYTPEAGAESQSSPLNRIVIV